MPDLTAAIRSEIVARVEAGDWPEVAAQRAGVDAATFRQWMDRGERPPAGERARKYRDLFAAVSRAEAVAEGDLVDTATGFDTKAAAAAVAVLERRFPDRWAKRVGRPPAPVAEEAPKPLSVVDELAKRRRGA